MAIILEDCSDLIPEHANRALVPLLVLTCRDSCVYDYPILRRDPGLAASLLSWRFWNLPNGPLTGIKIHWGIGVELLEISVGTQVSRSAPPQRILRGNPGPDNNLCCSGRPGQRRSEIDGGLLPEVILPGTTPT